MINMDPSCSNMIIIIWKEKNFVKKIRRISDAIFKVN